MTNNADAQIARMWASKALDNVWLNEVPIEGYRAAARHILATTTPPTMADMAEDEREACQWMQATFTKSPHEHIITQVFGKKARLLRRSDGAMFEVHHDEVIPYPDLPRLKWPTSAPSTEDTPEPEHPQPEDVPESTSEHPAVLTTEEDYKNAPEGTIVVAFSNHPWMKVGGFWGRNGVKYDAAELCGVPREVLRWGWAA